MLEKGALHVIKNPEEDTGIMGGEDFHDKELEQDPESFSTNFAELEKEFTTQNSSIHSNMTPEQLIHVRRLLDSGYEKILYQLTTNRDNMVQRILDSGFKEHSFWVEKFLEHKLENPVKNIVPVQVINQNN